MAASFHDQVVEVIVGLAPGEVVSYGEVATEAGFPGAARAVGAILASGVTAPARLGGGELPWWRVVTASGRLVPGHESEHARRLATEGVAVTNGHVTRASLRRPAKGRPTRRSRSDTI